MVKMQKGFTLIELMIVIAIIGILAALAVPQYAQYTQRAKFSEVKLAVSPIKTGVEDCYQRNAGDADCNTSTSTLPGAVNAAMLTRAATAGLVASVELVDDGNGNPLVRVISEIEEGFNGETYEITGSVMGTVGTNAYIEDWSEGGTGCTQGWC